MNCSSHKRMKLLTNTRPLIFILCLPLFFSFGFSMLGCKHFNITKEIRQTDTLISWVKRANETMVIDPVAISSRIDSMKIKLKIIKKDSAKIQNEVLKNYIKEYEGIYTQYLNFLELYQNLEFDNSVYSKQLNELKKKLIDREISPSEFGKMYPEIREKINIHLAKTKESVGTIASIEEMYLRLNNDITAVYHKLL